MPLTTADNIMTFRTVVKEVAIEQGVYATFMPKPMSAHPGSGMHTHMSLFEGDLNAFYDPSAHYQLSKIGRQFVAGLLEHAPEITAVTNQFVNSYKRLWAGDEAPSFVTWGHNNRSALVRVPLYKPNKGQSARVEYRAIDSAANPYLTFSLLLAAGLKGIENGYELPRRSREQRVGAHRRRAPCPRLPPAARAASTPRCRSWRSPSWSPRRSASRCSTMCCSTSAREWREYRAQVTPYELESNLEIL